MSATHREQEDRKRRLLRGIRSKATTYASRGWPIVRLYRASRDGCGCERAETCTNPGEHIKGKLVSATTDPSQLRKHWADTPWNVGVVLGGPAQLCAVQFSPGSGKREALPTTPHWRHGKKHVYLFSLPAGSPALSGALDVRDGVRLLGSGKYVAAPPSRLGAEKVQWIGDPDSPVHPLPQTLFPPSSGLAAPSLPTSEPNADATRPRTSAPIVASTLPLSAASLSLVGVAERIVAAGLSERAAVAALRQEAAALATPISDDELVTTLVFAERVAGPWSCLHPLDRAALVGLAGDIVANITQMSGAAEPAVLGTFLTLFAHSISRNVRFTFGRELHSPALFTSICGEPPYLGSDVPQLALTDIFDLASPPSHRNTPIRGLLNPRLKALLMPPDDDEPTFDLSARCGFVSEPSLERALHLISSRGALPIAEHLRHAWSQTDKKAGSNGFPLTILASLRLNADLQRTAWVERLPDLGARFLWIVANSSSVPADGPVDQQELQSLALRLRDRISGPLATAVTFSAGAETLSRRLGDPVRFDDRVVDTYVARAPHMLRRLSVVYACLAGRPEVTEDDVASAAAVWAYNVQSVRYIFGERDLQRAVSKLEAVFVQQGTLTRTQINSALSNNASAALAARALSILERRGSIIQVPSQSGPKGGRIPDLWRWCST